AVLFATDEEPVEDDDEPVEEAADESSNTTAQTATAQPAEAPKAAPATSSGPRPDDLTFDAADGTKLLVAWWTKLRLDQIGAADSIESLCDGVSSRRNQLLVDLGGELGLGAIDGAAEADIPTLSTQVTGLARTYKPFGPVLSEAVSDHLKKVLGPTGKKQASITERVTDTWQLGPGWAKHVVAELALATRDGSSVRGGDLGTVSGLSSAADVESAVDASVQAVADRHGVSVDLPSAGGGEATVDAAALAEITGEITGDDGVLASTARHLLSRLGLDDAPAAPGPNGTETSSDDAEVLARVEAELGSDWVNLTAPAFDERRALLIDDRWASAREDVARIAAGHDIDAELVGSGFVGAGDIVAGQAGWWASRTDDTALRERLERIAKDAVSDEPGTHAGEVAVVTGASKGSIAASVVGRLLAGGATVVATTSSLGDRKMRFFRELYRSNARAGAALWVVPANMASFTDVDDLAAWITSAQTRTVGSSTVVVKPALTPTALFP
ncbi:MAG: 3-oxoacyl-ACP synthase, partial [Aeromicrobium sp.]